MTVPEIALTRFRDYAASLRHLYAASGDCQRRLNDCLRARHELAAERDRVATSRWSPRTDIKEAVAEKLGSLDAELARASAEVSRLQVEFADIEARRASASDLVGRLQAFLLERGASRAEVSY